MKKIFATLLLVVALFSLTVAAQSKMVTFTVDDKYIVVDTIPLPYTIEAKITFPKSYQARGGVIIGNYSDSSSSCMNFEIYEKGVPRLYITEFENSMSKTYDLKFDKVDVRTGKAMHLAVTIDPVEKTVLLYVDGTLAQEIKREDICDSFDFKESFVIGGDLRSGNTNYFKGVISNIALYKDVRTAGEILADSTADKLDKNSLAAAWEVTNDEIIKDLSTNGHDVKCTKDWLDKSGFDGEYAYSFALVGDTQIVNLRYPDKLHCIYDWIIDNAEEKKIKFVFGLGDITDQNNLWEWALAKALITKMDGVVPYSLVRGNHDSIENYKKIFPLSEYEDVIEESYDGTMLNTYQTFEAGNLKYLVLCLDYAASDAALAWADKVVSSHPDYNVIVTTHVYLHSDGTTVDGNDPTPATKYGASNNADEVWEKFVKKHKNITMHFSGHRPSDNIVVSKAKGINGNTVTQILVDPQDVDAQRGAAGLVAMLYFSEDGKTVSTEYYSTIRDKFFLSENNLTFTVDVIESQGTDTENAKEPQETQKVQESPKTQETSKTQETVKIEFSDVNKNDYFFDTVNWAVNENITQGTSDTTFSPDSTCTTAQILTFLWRAAGCPEPSIENPYTDVKPEDYFYKAALWAKQEGVYNPDGNKFSPDSSCTRASTVGFFWRFAGSESVQSVVFSDVKESTELEKAVSWAVTKGITAGTGEASFTPDAACTRAQIVTFLYRYFVAPVDNSDFIAALRK